MDTMRGPRRPALRALAIDHGGALVLAVLAYYLWRACPFVVENDQAEFSTLSAIGGVAHPPGYPLHVLWLRAWSWLPVASPALAASIATALAGAAAVLVLHAAARAWGARPLAATAAVGMYALAPLVARYHTMAEVFAINHLVIAGVLWLAAERGPLRGTTRAVVLGLVAGLGLSNHLTCVLVAPVGLLGLVRAARDRSWAWAVPAAMLGLALGLLPYGYLLIAPDNLAGNRVPHGLGDIIDLFLRRAYGGPLAFSQAGADVPAQAYLADLGHSLGVAWSWVLLPAACVGLGAGMVRPAGESRGAWIALAASVALAGPILALRFDLPLDSYGRWVTARFHLMPATLLVLPVSIGLDRITQIVAPRMPARLVAPGLIGALVVLGLVVRAAATLPYLERHQTPALENVAKNLLLSLPPQAILVGGVNEIDVGIRYQQLARGVRSDVLYFRLEGLLVDWYRARLVPYGIDFVPTAGEDFRVRFAEYVMATGRPLFMGLGYGAGLDPLPRFPHGMAIRVLPRGATPPSLREVSTLNERLFGAFDLAYLRPGLDDDAATWMHQIYETVWRQIATSLGRAGDRAAMSRAEAIADQLAPTTD